MVKVRVGFGFMAGFVVRVRAREGLGLVLWLNLDTQLLRQVILVVYVLIHICTALTETAPLVVTHLGSKDNT